MTALSAVSVAGVFSSLGLIKGPKTFSSNLGRLLIGKPLI